ncbi:ribbon-helix-helix protein, CopG family [Mobilicoccus caccae]|uniref:Ribbon-helix-helix protein CopG domain-containing protein n=1 Tax=Mobilicoccus caccae TaxID=1859295 RepID=A0ABQ6ISH5_9MICO|nr:ribbon-helix-helix protein, CopG family [Mobilicoccus caccae]GMA40883.1 hypothetical protein GCM10025883_29280 [Mobilicoccus caccae]
MKVSVSLPEEDVALLDAVASERSTGRSAVVHEAVELLREKRLAEEYAEAAREWDSSGEGRLWSAADADGISNAAW